MSDLHKPLEYPFKPLEKNQRTALVEGIDAVRLSVPWALDHVNCWLIHEQEASGSASTLIDTGINNKATRAVWETLLDNALPRRLLVTHYHPDHSGLSGWFQDQGVSCYSHANEIDVMHEIWATSPEVYVQEFSDWYTRHGLDETQVNQLSRVGHGYRATVAKLPVRNSWNALSAGDEINLGGRQFEVLVGHGHAPSMLMFFCADEKLLIAADQILPKISPNISVFPGTPDQNPLDSFLTSLDQFFRLPEDTLVLPSHGEPFFGLHQRVRVLQEHHQERLDRLRNSCTVPMRAADVLSTLFERKLDVQQTSFALGEAIAHLRYLVGEGEMVEHTESGTAFFSPA